MKSCTTTQDGVKDLLDNKKIWWFIKWYLNGQKEDEWEQVQKVLSVNITPKEGLEKYLQREDVQRAMIEITKLNKDFNLVQIYNKMLEKALDGDYNSANWIVKFSESEFFDKKKSKIEDMLGSLTMEE